MKKPLKVQGVDYLFEQMEAHELKYEYMTAKFDLTLINDKQKQELNGQVRIKRDSIIWLSLSPALGIEVARLAITQDSVLFLNRMNKTYFKGDYEFINSVFDTHIDFDILQAIITGNDLSQYDNVNFKADIDGQEYRLSTAKRQKLKKFVEESEEHPKVFIMSLWLDPEVFKIRQMNIKEIKKENKKLQVSYEEYQQIADQRVPTQLYFDLQAENKIYLDVRYKKVELNKAKNFKINIPSKYEALK